MLADDISADTTDEPANELADLVSEAGALPADDDLIAALRQAWQGDPWTWCVGFADGSTLDEYDDDAPSGHGWSDVEQAAQQRGTVVAGVLLVPHWPALSTHVAALREPERVTPGLPRLWVFRRRSLSVSMQTGQQMRGADPITIIALVPDAGAPDKVCYTFLFTDGSVSVSDDLNAV